MEAAAAAAWLRHIRRRMSAIARVGAYRRLMSRAANGAGRGRQPPADTAFYVSTHSLYCCLCFSLC